MAFNTFEKAFRLRAKELITGRELVSKVFDDLAYDGDFEQVADITKRLLERDAADVSDWLEWVEQRCNDPQWIPFHLVTRNGPTDFDREMSRKFGRIAESVRSILEEYRTNLENEGNKRWLMPSLTIAGFRFNGISHNSLLPRMGRS
jgi:hypothetical protein